MAMKGRGFIRTNFYSGAGLNRADAQRADPDLLNRHLDDPGSHFLLVWRSHNFVDDQARPRRLQRQEAEPFLTGEHEVVFLGLEENRALIAIDISDHEEPERHETLSGHGAFRDLRETGPLMPQQEGAILAYARGLMHWHRRHLFCGVCGAPTESANSGHVRNCTNPTCRTSHFPRTDPAVIMLIHDGAGSCVLGRQKIWPPGMHSTLAGFVEPGESLEEAVAREIEEEVGLDIPVESIHYHSSQPWPFPSSIMLGFHAECARQELKINYDEIEQADWYSKEDLLNSPEDENFKLPRKDSIARRLIEDWLEGE